MQVTVELEDLETIVFATAVIKQIENALQARKRDPFVQPHLDYSKAHTNLVAAMNSAKRANAGTLIDWNGELTYTEVTFLREVDRLFQKTSAYLELLGEFRIKEEFYFVDSLAAKGCIQIGQSIVGAVWPGDNQAQIRPYPTFQVRITDRGRSKLEEYSWQGQIGRI